MPFPAASKQSPHTNVTGQCGRCCEVLYKDPESGETYSLTPRGQRYRCYGMPHAPEPDGTDKLMAVLSK